MYNSFANGKQIVQNQRLKENHLKFMNKFKKTFINNTTNRPMIIYNL